MMLKHRVYAAWALGRIESQRSAKVLMRHLEIEKSPVVRQEILTSLRNLGHD